VTSNRLPIITLAALALTFVRPAAAGLSARLVYLRSGSAEACPDQAALKKAVAKRLGYDPFLAAAAHTIVAEVSGNGEQLRARARLLDDAGLVLGSRELVGKGENCGELLASLALAISLTLDPMVVASVTTEPLPGPDDARESELPRPLTSESNTREASSTTGSARPEPAAQSASAPEQPTTKPIALPSRRPLSLALQAQIFGALGWVPNLSPAFGLGVELRDRFSSLELNGVHTFAQTRASGSDQSATVSLTYAALAPCAWLGPFAGCALGTLGSYRASGNGVDTPRSASHLHAATGLRAKAALAISAHMAILFDVDGVKVLTRPRFLVAGQEIYQAAPWAANLGVFLQWQLF